MNIILINGNSSRAVSKGISEATATIVGSEFKELTFEVVTPSFGPSTVEGYLDGDLAAIAVASEVAKWNNDGDAFVIACFSDPGLYAAREITNKPVIGIAQASMAVAVQLGHVFSILTPLSRLRPVLNGLVRRYGFQDHCSSIESVALSVADAKRDREQTINLFIEAGERSVMHGAEVIILGGAVLAGMENEISAALGIPVLDPVKCAIGQAVLLAKLGLKTSKNGGFATPRNKDCADCPDELGLFYNLIHGEKEE
jgi:allantoin racemase